MLDRPETSPPKAYSYLRFSTPEQMKGDSLRRQTALAEAYAARRGFVLDETLRLEDKGVSAFRGNNSISGNFGRFIEHVKSGEIQRGSYLLVESLDRITRQQIGEALMSFLNLLNSGINIVTLIDEQEYSWGSFNVTNGANQLFGSLSIMVRAHEESATKSRRLREAWGAKRAAIGTKALTSIMPAWLELDPETRQPRLIPERQAVVEKIFQDSLSGHGQHAIAAALNKAKVKPWGRGKFWHRSYIAKILQNDAVIGTLRPHTMDHVDGRKQRIAQEPVPDYFPPAISLELWKEVRAFAVGKRARARGRHANAPITNMLAGLAACPLCDGTMTRVNKGARSRPKYVCVRGKTRAGCTYKSVSVELVEDAIVERLPERLRDAPAGERNPELDKMIEDASGALDIQREKIDRLIAAIEEGQSGIAISGRLDELESEFFATKSELERLETMRAAVAGRTVHARIDKLRAALEPEEGEPDVAAINLALQSVFKRVVIDYQSGLLEFEWIHAGSVELPYALPEE